MLGLKKNNTSESMDKKQLLQSYNLMLKIRRFEEKTGQLYGMGLIRGFCHLCIGQEAIPAGIKMAMSEGDAMITSYRDHGIMLASGSDPKSVMAELLGKASGCSKGKGGSMHMFDIPNHYYGGHGIVGAQVPIGTGIALKYKYCNENNVCFTLFGDGAAHQGQVYESFNIAKLHNLPVIYVIENNEYGMGTSTARASCIQDLYKRGISFGIPGEQVDGMDITKIYNVAQKAIKHAEKEGPYIIEMKTYRYRGHSMSDPAKYRTREEVDEVKNNRDPLTILKNILVTKHKVKEDEFKTMEKEIKAIVNEATEFAKSSPEPEESELFTDIVNKVDS